jgi:lipopolysaccharide export system protein LptC
MVHYPDDDSALLEAVALEAFEPRQPKMTLTADHGRLEEGGDRVTIEGNVVIVREGDARIEPLRITTDKLLVLPDEGKASTRSEVTMQSPSSHAVASGLDLDNRARTVRLDQVQATYKPQR